MNAQIRDALQGGGIIDITTTGRKSGRPHRIEIAFHSLNGKVYISGMPGRRDWYANLLTHSDFTFHLKRGLKAELAAHATPILGEAERRELLRLIAQAWGRERSLEQFVADSPLVEVTFPGDES